MLKISISTMLVEFMSLFSTNNQTLYRESGYVTSIKIDEKKQKRLKVATNTEKSQKPGISNLRNYISICEIRAQINLLLDVCDSSVAFATEKLFRSVKPPGTRLDEINGGKFGFSVACLGLTDTGSQGRKMVAVGAPYYGTRGAVFVYRTTSGSDELELSQTILPSIGISTGFGMKLSDVLENSNGVTKGFGVGAPEADTLTYIRTKTVVRFKDDSRIGVNPTSIDPRKNPQITLSVQPRIVKQSVYNNNVIVTVTVTWDSRRLESSQSGIETTTLRGGNNIGDNLQFKYSLNKSLVGDSNLNLNDPNYNPIRYDLFFRTIFLYTIVQDFLFKLSTVSLHARRAMIIHVQSLIPKIMNMERFRMKVDREFLRNHSQQELSLTFATFLKVANAMLNMN